jgi:hypothetical protein
VCAAGAAFLLAALALWALGLRRAPAAARDGSRGNPARPD